MTTRFSMIGTRGSIYDGMHTHKKWQSLAKLLVSKRQINLPLVKSLSDHIAILRLQSIPGANAHAIRRVENNLAYIDFLRYSPRIVTNVHRIVHQNLPRVIHRDDHL